jgi:EpsI family protein
MTVRLPILLTRFGPALLALLLLAGLVAEQERHRRSQPDPAPYLARVRRAMLEQPCPFPYSFGDWSGRDEPVPTAALTMLKPNVILSRRYSNSRTGQTVNVLFVHCSNANDLLGHYPPVCYNGQGWTLTNTEPRDWQSGVQPVQGMEYRFTRQVHQQTQSILIADYFALPTGATVRSMEALQGFAKDRFNRSLGAAQVQFIVDGETSSRDAESIFHQFFEATAPLLQVVLNPGR